MLDTSQVAAWDNWLACVIGLGTARTRRLARIYHVQLIDTGQAQPTCVLLVTQVYNEDIADAVSTHWILDVNNDQCQLTTDQEKN